MQMSTHTVPPSVVTYNILIDFCAVHGRISEVCVCVCVCVCVHLCVCMCVCVCLCVCLLICACHYHEVSSTVLFFLSFLFASLIRHFFLTRIITQYLFLFFSSTFTPTLCSPPTLTHFSPTTLTHFSPPTPTHFSPPLLLISHHQAIKVLAAMRLRNLFPDYVTYNTLLKLCIANNDSKGVQEVRTYILSSISAKIE